MEKWIRLEQDDYIYFIPRFNIAGVNINKKKPTELNILMCGDAETTAFAFADTNARNAKLDEILEREEVNNTLEGQLHLDV